MIHSGLEKPIRGKMSSWTSPSTCQSPPEFAKLAMDTYYIDSPGAIKKKNQWPSLGHQFILKQDLKKKKICIYLAASGLSCGSREVHCIMRSFTVVHGLYSMVHRLSEAGRLSFSMACRLLAPWPGIEPTSPTFQGGFLTTGPPRKSLPRWF